VARSPERDHRNGSSGGLRDRPSEWSLASRALQPHFATVDDVEIGLIPTARRAISAARASAPFSIELLMSIASVGTVIIGATDEAD
jgi:hypothetical protein